MSKPAADEILADPEGLFAGLAESRGMVLAVSGGPDSTALMVLAAQWRSRPPALVVTVDHGLRPEAASEAGLVSENAAKLGLSCRIMRVPEPPGGGNLQDWARRARYRCLVKAAREAGFDAIVTAHHLEDQAETFLMRLARGSGVYGLAAMADESNLEGLRLLRPFLALPRAVLAEVVATSGLPTVDDPSNRDRRFDRVRLREIAPLLEGTGLTPVRLGQTAGRLGRASAALDHYAHNLLRKHFHAGADGVVSGPALAFAEPPEEVCLRALSLMMAAVGGADYGPRLDRLEALWRSIVTTGSDGSLKRTLHGAVLRVAAGRLTAHREWGRRGPAAVTAPSGTDVIWDRRFRVQVPAIAGDFRVGALGQSGALGHYAARTSVAREAALTLPCLYGSSGLVAVPDILADLASGDDRLVLPIQCLVGPRLGFDCSDARSAKAPN